MKIMNRTKTQKYETLITIERWAEKMEKETDNIIRLLQTVYRKELQDITSDEFELWDCIDSIADAVSDVIERVKDIRNK